MPHWLLSNEGSRVNSLESRRSLALSALLGLRPRRRGASQGCTDRYGTQGSESPPPQGTAYRSHTLLSACSWLRGSGEGWVASARYCTPCLPRPIPPASSLNRLPCVVLQVAGRSKQRGPGHHCFLQSESEAGGIAGRVSALAQPRTPKCRGMCLRPPTARCPVPPVGWTFSCITLRVNQA